MTTEERARAFIDDIVKINAEHGMGTYWPAYESAVGAATKRARLLEAHGRTTGRF